MTFQIPLWFWVEINLEKSTHMNAPTRTKIGDLINLNNAWMAAHENEHTASKRVCQCDSDEGKSPIYALWHKWDPKCLNWTFIEFYWEIHLISWKWKREQWTRTPALNYDTHTFLRLRFATENSRSPLCAGQKWCESVRVLLLSVLIGLAWLGLSSPSLFISTTYKLINGI